MTYGDKPFGLRDVKLTNIAGTTQVDLPAAMTFSFKERLVTGEMKGDDVLMSVVTFPEGVEWEIEAGGISLEAWALMTGRTLTASGTTPTRTNTYAMSGGQCYPYFKVYGKAVGDDCASDIHAKLVKCKLTSPLEGSFKNGEFFMTKASGLAVPNDSNLIGEIVQNETATTLPTS